MQKVIQGIIISVWLLASSEQAMGQADWSNQPTPPPVNSPTLGPVDLSFDSQVGQGYVVCNPSGTLPPCGAGDSPNFAYSSPLVPTNSLGPNVGSNSNLGVSVVGGYSDPTSPAGVSFFRGYVSLNAFATAASVDGLASAVDTLSTSIADIQQQLAVQDRSMRQGVAMSLAMDGTGTLGPDEHFALSMNWGTFGGQNGVAGSVAFRAADHVTFDGGIGTGLHGGLVGGRAGVRIAW